MLTLNSPIKTPYHQIPAGYKVCFLMIFSTLLYSLKLIPLVFGGFLFVVVLVGYCGIEFLKLFLRRLIPIYPFLLIICFWHFITNTMGEGIFIGLILLTVFGLANLVTMTTRLDDMIDLMNIILKPFARIGLNVAPFGIAIALVLRTIPKIIAIANNISLSWRSRSLKTPNWRIIFPLVCLTLDDGEQVAEAIKARRVFK